MYEIVTDNNKGWLIVGFDDADTEYLILEVITRENDFE